MGFFVRRPTEVIEAYRYESDGSNCVELMRWLGAGEHESDEGDCGKSPIFFDAGSEIKPGEWAVMAHPNEIFVYSDTEFRKRWTDATDSDMDTLERLGRARQSAHHPPGSS